MRFEPSENELQYFDQELFKNKGEIKTIISYYYFYSCSKLMLDKLKIEESQADNSDSYRPFAKLCMAKYLMQSQPACLEKWNTVDWIKKDFTARERRDLFKKIENCNRSGMDPKLIDELNVAKHYFELFDTRVGLTSKLLPQLYKNLTSLEEFEDVEKHSLINIQKIIKENDLEKQAKLSEFNKDLDTTFQHFPLKYSLLSRDYFAPLIINCIKSERRRERFFSNEEVLERTKISEQLGCIFNWQISFE